MSHDTRMPHLRWSRLHDRTASAAPDRRLLARWRRPALITNCDQIRSQALSRSITRADSGDGLMSGCVADPAVMGGLAASFPLPGRVGECGGLPGRVAGQQTERRRKLVPDLEQDLCPPLVFLLVHEVEAKRIGDAVDQVEREAHVDSVP